jgi:Uma2 family endonuclease
MIAVATPIHQIKLAPDSAMMISGLTWVRYKALLNELGDDRSTRTAYDHGTLEIRMPGEAHEIINRLLAKIITMLALELGIEANDFGSTTLNRKSIDRGIEPDSCFYIQNAMRGMAVKVSDSLSPDLAVEVDIASSSVGKMEIYQAIGIPEIWLYRRSILSIQCLRNGQYVDSLTSLSFPITVELLNKWIELRKTETDLTVLRSVQQFFRLRSEAS